MNSTLKPTASTAEHIQRLRSRGMGVDSSLAEQWLSNVGYYRLSAYWYPAREAQPDGTIGDAFRPETTFEDAVELYEADRKLRTLLHDGMGRVEVALRTKVTEVLCADGPLAYAEASRFRSGFAHSEWLMTARRRIDRARRHNAAIQHYASKYAGQYPLWVLAEVLDFADVSRLYEGLRAQDQHCIAERFNISPDLSALTRAQRSRARSESPLVRWLEQLTIIRNTCAHHGRLWNKSFVPTSTVALRTQPELSALPAGQSERLFGALLVAAHLVRSASPGTSWPEKVTALLVDSFLTNALVEPRAMGIPATWNKKL